MRWNKQNEPVGAATGTELAENARTTTVNLERARASLGKGPGVGGVPRKVGSAAAGATAIGTMAIGSLALGALALGAVAVGAFAIGRLSVGRARIGRLEIGRLRIGALEIDEILPPAHPASAGHGRNAA